MGDTKRNHIYEIPMATRSTDVSMMNQCAGRWALTLLREPEQADASFFIRGEGLHRAIEIAIKRNVDLDKMKTWIDTWIQQTLEQLGSRRSIESSRSGFDTMSEDAERMLTNWFRFVHPDSDKRHPLYDDYEWPPRVELPFERSINTGTRYPVWGSIDALFTSKGMTKHHRIVDWKSNTQKPDSHFQLQFYRFGMGLGNTPANFHMLDRIRQPSIVVEAEDYPGDDFIRKAIHETENVKLRLLDGVIPDFNPDWYCNYCSVQHLCPVDGDPRNRKENLRILKRRVKLAVPLTVVGR